MLRIVSIAFIVLVGALVTAQNLDVNITAALASLSIGGLAVGLAAQDTLGNLFGAVALFVDKPFRIGDHIKTDAGLEGRVEAVGLRSTRMRSPEGHLVAGPNKTMRIAAITNMTDRPGIRTVMNFVLSRTLPVTAVKRGLAILEQVYGGHPMTDKVQINLNQLSAAGVNVQVVHWWKGEDYEKYLAGVQEMNLAVKERFDAEGIALA